VAEQNKSIKLEHFENLVAMAAADGHMDEEEKEFLAEKAAEFGLKLDEITDILNNPHDLVFKVPSTQDEKEEQLSDAVFMAMIDGEIHEKEYAMCINFATKLGLSQKDVDEIISLAKKLFH
jgi:tellurite resistance protein